MAALCATACKKNGSPPSAPPKTPSVRLYVVGTVAGAMEPCGCRKDMLGGIDHAAALMSGSPSVGPSLVVGAGPMLFMNTTLGDERRAQDIWKAESIAESFAELRLSAWAPGFNDFVAGADQLDSLGARAKARVLASNLKLSGTAFPGHHIAEVGGYKVGFAGVSAPTRLGVAPAGVTISELAPALAAAVTALRGGGAQILVALVAAPRGDALRLAESVGGFDVMVVGKPFDEGEANDAVTPPVLVGTTLVVQPPNHLQAVGVVDLFVRDGSFDFQDGSGIEAQARADSLSRKAAALERRIELLTADGKVKPAELARLRLDLAALKADVGSAPKGAPPPKGSFFRYAMDEVRESGGSDPRVAKRMEGYYQRVNDHNRVAFADRKPPPSVEGQPRYVGVDECSGCHDEAEAFWKETRHAVAYSVLEKEHKQFNLDCVGCHVTGYEKPGGSTVTHVEQLRSVQCETCHGPGSAHAEDPETAGKITLRPEESVCAGCHHAPHVADGWSAKENWHHIIGNGHGAAAAARLGRPGRAAGAEAAPQVAPK